MSAIFMKENRSKYRRNNFNDVKFVVTSFYNGNSRTKIKV